MKRVVKLTEKQLREIVKEASNADRHHASMKHTPCTAVIDVTKKIGDFWRETYSKDDPSQASLGKDAWDAQVESAVEELYDRFIEVLVEVDEKLTTGEYHGG